MVTETERNWPPLFIPCITIHVRVSGAVTSLRLQFPYSNNIPGKLSVENRRNGVCINHVPKQKTSSARQ